MAEATQQCRVTTRSRKGKGVECLRISPRHKWRVRLCGSDGFMHDKSGTIKQQVLGN